MKFAAQEATRSQSGASTISTANDIPCTYKCATCGSLWPPTKPLKLCEICKNKRYCNDTCQKMDRIQHKKVCVAIDKIHASQPDPTRNGVDPRHSSNPLGLRTQPAISDDEISQVASRMPHDPDATTAVATMNAVGAVASQLPREPDMAHMPLVMQWDASARRDDRKLSSASEEWLINKLRAWVYRRLETHEKIKALRMRRLAILAGDYNGDIRKARCVEELGKEVEEVGYPVYAACRYFEARKYFADIEGEWLHESLLKKLPATHKHSRFSSSKASPEKDIVSTLFELGIQGIDEGSFWELEDWVDGLKLGQIVPTQQALI